MTKETALKIMAVQERVMADPDYPALMEEYRVRSKELLDLLQRLPPKDAAVVEDYLGLEGEIYRRQLECACK